MKFEIKPSQIKSQLDIYNAKPKFTRYLFPQPDMFKLNQFYDNLPAGLKQSDELLDREKVSQLGFIILDAKPETGHATEEVIYNLKKLFGGKEIFDLVDEIRKLFKNDPDKSSWGRTGLNTNECQDYIYLLASYPNYAEDILDILSSAFRYHDVERADRSERTGFSVYLRTRYLDNEGQIENLIKSKDIILALHKAGISIVQAVMLTLVDNLINPEYSKDIQIALAALQDKKLLNQENYASVVKKPTNIIPTLKELGIDFKKYREEKLLEAEIETFTKEQKSFDRMQKSYFQALNQPDTHHILVHSKIFGQTEQKDEQADIELKEIVEQNFKPV